MEHETIDQYEWLVRALADEIASNGAAQAGTLLARLRADLGYASADPGFAAAERAAQARIALVERIARRLDRSGEAAALRLVRRSEIAA